MTDERAAYIAGLRALATVIEDNPVLPLPYEGQLSPLNWFLHGGSPRVQLAALARVIPCTWEKRVWGQNDEHFELKGQLAGLRLALNAEREAVCTRRVVGTEEREVEETVTPAVTRKVTKTVDVVEWDCGSLLRPEPAAPEVSGPVLEHPTDPLNPRSDLVPADGWDGAR